MYVDIDVCVCAREREKFCVASTSVCLSLDLSLNSWSVAARNSLLDKDDRAAAVLFPLDVRLVRENAGLVVADLGRELCDERLDGRELVGVRGDDGDDVDLFGRRRHGWERFV